MPHTFLGMQLLAPHMAVGGYAAGETYYVDATLGLDTNPGTTQGQPWQTIAKVNAATLWPGDSVLFKRGETWNERLWPVVSGLAGHHIVFGAYGTGAKPVLNGAGFNDSILVSANSHLTFQDLSVQLADGGGAGYGVRLTNVCDDISLIRIDAVNCVDAGFWIDQSTNITIDSCTATGCLVGVQFWGGSHDCQVVDGSFYSNDKEGLDIENGAYSIEVDGVTCYSNTLAGFDVDSGAYNCTYKRCRAYSNGANGFSIANDGDGFRYENCLSYTNTGNGWELQAGTGDGITIVHCTSANNTSRNYRLDGGLGHVFKNNIAKKAGWGYQFRVAAAVLAAMTLDYNCYYNVISCVNNVDANDYATIALWRTATGQEANSQFADPLLVTEFTDMHLGVGSPCIAAGDPTVGVLTDYDGVVRGAVVDIGAYEYV